MLWSFIDKTSEAEDKNTQQNFERAKTNWIFNFRLQKTQSQRRLTSTKPEFIGNRLDPPS